MDAASCPSCSAPLSGNRCAGCGSAARAGAFRVLSVLAQSPHGRTYRAQGPAGMVALQELVFALVPTAQQLDAFEREARLLGSVSNPQIPRVIDSFREGEGPALRLYLAQELVEGEPLSSRIGIDESEARIIARQLLNILRYLHERGIVHRDVKPANVLRRPDGTLVLVDFGAARAVEGVTHGATLVGTFGYMPPEQLGGTVDATADLYALGATLVHLMGRKAPEDILGPDLELRLDHLNVSPAFRAFLARLTARKRTSRPASAVEALLALDAPAPALPPCYRQAGIELARVSVWPSQKALQLKVVQHSRNPSCDWTSLEVAASTETGIALHSPGAMGETPRDGWREILYNFDLPDGVRAVRLDVK